MLGFRLRQSTRPSECPPEDWGKLNAIAKHKIRVAWCKEQALLATMAPEDSWPREVAQRCADELCMDLYLWGPAGLRKMEMGDADGSDDELLSTKRFPALTAVLKICSSTCDADIQQRTGAQAQVCFTLSSPT